MGLVGLQDAEMLNICSPSDFSVRLKAFDREFYCLKDELNKFYSRHSATLKLGPELARSLKPRDAVAVVHESCWSRAVLVSTDHQYRVTVWLIDYGKKHESTVGAVYSLDDRFLKENAFSFRCHLPRVREKAGTLWPAEATVEMEALVEKYGSDVQIEAIQDTIAHGGVREDGIPSLAVNLTWSYEEAISPVEPMIKKTINLLAKLYSLQSSDKSSEEDMNLSELADSLTEAINLSPSSDDETDFKNSLSNGTQNERTNSNFRWPNPEIPSDDEFLAHCTHVDHAGQFYLQMENTKSTIKSMHDELSSKHSGEKKSSTRVKEGSECIARYVDGRFYRGRVLSYGPFEGRSRLSDEAQVLFVDFGHPSIVKIKNIRSNLTFKKLPIQAVRVVLHDVKPKNGGLWPESCLDFMYQKTNCVSNINHSPVRVTIVGDNRTMPLQAKISVPSKNGIWVDLSDLLVEAGDADYDYSFVKMFEVQKLYKKESHGIGYVPPLSYRPNDNLAPEKMIEVNLPLDFPFHNPPDPLRSVKPGDTVRVKLASVMSCNRIYVHPVVEEHSANSGGSSLRVHSELKMLGSQYEAMMRRLQEDAPGMPPVIHPTRGLPVAAKFQVEGCLEKLWYRGIIHTIMDGKVKVIFVDFDRTSLDVESTQLVKLPSFCGDVPVIGMEMKLGVVAADDEEVAGVVMGECLWRQGGVLTAKIISTNPRQAHIINPATRMPVYSSLTEDGFIKIKID